MNKSNLYIILLLGFTINCLGQNISINYDIDTTVFKVAEPLNLWLDFLNTKDDSIGAKYWNSDEVEKYGNDSYFLIERELQFGIDNYLQLLSYSNIKVLSIRKIMEYYKITSLMEFSQKENTSNIQYIFHVYAAQENGELKLFNPLPINSDLYFFSSIVGFIKFHYPKVHNFNYRLAKKQIDFLESISKNFDVPIDTIDYYFASSVEEIQKIKGFDFIIGDNGNQIASGKADSKNRIVYSSGLDEYYPHEFIHILLNPYYPNCHFWINEGVATYFGMSRGKDLDWHLIRLNKHLIQHPEIDLNNMLKLRSLDQYTDYRYVLGGFIISMAYEKGGFELIKILMNAGKTDEDFYSAIENYLEIRKENLNQYIRTALETTYNNINKKKN
ncbi:MAG: hypothetical protein HN704_04270 [Bacteroidetes bacterium]|jgi:hypothetical protein|nr:hypothetical protein [Bacteroidota bacterium]MBT6687105.1 hypothetical protein [Bacteroidota bacterium]MBT7144480.1 hypothetical protein [Bacteroidota bacterium]MBT7490807.1 hypothetical protein [Bacteroidota bacterium]